MIFVNNPRPYANIRLLLFAVMLLIAAGCKKDKEDNKDNPDSFTPVPSTTPVNTIITAYVPFKGTDVPNVDIGASFGDYYKGAFFKSGTFDQFGTYISAGYPVGTKYFGAFRVIPVSDAPRNYTDIAGQEQLRIANVSTGNGGGYFPLSKGGKITYPVNAFGAPVGSGTINADFLIGDPTEPAFVISNPTVAVDFDNQRWYLRSYGSLFTHFDLPLLNGKMADLEWPIPANLMVNAPDSIETWHLELGAKWIKKGVAQKQGNVYKYTLPADGSWCFGTRQKGIYKTFQVRTGIGIPVINAIVHIKSGAIAIGAARTDANGNAVCFVPANETLTVTIPPSWTSPENPKPLTATVGPFNFDANTPARIDYATGTKLLRTLKGKVIKCDGTPVQKGTITVVRQDDKFEFCHIPVVNGQYSGAIVVDNMVNPDYFILRLKDDVANLTGNDTAITWDAGTEKNIDLSTCKGPTNLYMDYTVDGASYSIKGDVASNLGMTYDVGTGAAAMISTSEGSKGLEFHFPASFSKVGVHNTGFDWVWVNGVHFPNCLGTLTLTRFDLLVGGYVEGSFDMHYYDGAAVEHTIKGKFRLYRAS